MIVCLSSVNSFFESESELTLLCISERQSAIVLESLGTVSLDSLFCDPILLNAVITCKRTEHELGRSERVQPAGAGALEFLGYKRAPLGFVADHMPRVPWEVVHRALPPPELSGCAALRLVSVAAGPGALLC